MIGSDLRIGISGTGPRGAELVAALRASGRGRVLAVHDPFDDARSRFAAEQEIEVTCSTFEELLDRVDVAILASPAQHHGPQACAALARGVHVLSEVPAVVSHQQALDLVEAARASDAMYALAENYRYFLPNLIVRELIRRGDLGTVYYGESDYFVDARSLLRDQAGNPTWQHHWWTGRDGHTYPTHSLGPLLQWFDERISAVSCVGAGRHGGGGHEIQDATVTLARTVNGKLLRLGLSWLAPRPLQSHCFRVQGTTGVYDQGDPRRGSMPAVFIAEAGDEVPDFMAHAWKPLEPYAADLLPSRYPAPRDLAAALDSSAGEAWALEELWMLQDFFAGIEEGRPVDVDVYSALDLTLPGFAAEASIARGGDWVEVPNPRLLTAGIGPNPGREAPLA